MKNVSRAIAAALFAPVVLIPMSMNASGDVADPAAARELLEKEMAEAARARDAHAREDKEFQLIHGRIIEKRKIDRRRRAAKVDPDLDSFWRREQTARFGRQLILTIPLGRRVILYRSKDPLQFHGRQAHMHRRTPRVRSGKRAPRHQADITKALTKARGHYILLSVPEGPGPVNLKGDVELLSTVINGETYDLVNIYSDGVDILLVEMELRGRAGVAGEFFHWSVDRIFLEQK